MLLICFLIILALTIIFLIYYGIIFPQKVDYKTSESFYYFYKEKRGNFDKIGKAYNEILKILVKNKIQYTYLIPCSFYFDDPDKIKNLDDMRWTIGVRANNKNKKLAEKYFLKNNFKIKKIPKLKNIYTLMKFRNYFSYFFISIFWKRMFRFLKKENKGLELKRGTVFEFYRHIFTNKKIIEFFIPVGKNLDLIDFCSLKKSEYKLDKKLK